MNGMTCLTHHIFLYNKNKNIKIIRMNAQCVFVHVNVGEYVCVCAYMCIFIGDFERVCECVCHEVENLALKVTPKGIVS